MESNGKAGKGSDFWRGFDWGWVGVNTSTTAFKHVSEEEEVVVVVVSTSFSHVSILHVINTCSLPAN